jgi:hypothetical protein
VEDILPESQVEGGCRGEGDDRRRGEVAQIIYTHVSKCENDKIKNFKKIKNEFPKK